MNSEILYFSIKFYVKFGSVPASDYWSFVLCYPPDRQPVPKFRTTQFKKCQPVIGLKLCSRPLAYQW